jgi:hypothetical protein
MGFSWSHALDRGFSLDRRFHGLIMVGPSQANGSCLNIFLKKIDRSTCHHLNVFKVFH